MTQQFGRDTGERLKILFLTNRVPFPVRDGQTRRTYHILKGLAETHEVHLLSLYESPRETERETLNHLNSFCKRVEILPAPSKRWSLAMAARLLRSLFSPDPYTIWRHYSGDYLERMQARLRDISFDVVHCDILPLAYCIRDLNGPFRALTDHDVSYLKARRLAGRRRNPASQIFLYYEALKLKRLERRIFRKVDLGIAVSEVDRRHLQSLCPEGRFAVIENGVDVATFVPKPEAAEPDTLVWIGGLHDDSNHEAILFFLKEIYPRIKRQKAGAKLYLVGEVPDRLAKLASRDRSIVTTGYVEDPVPYLQRASVFIAPILSGGGTKLKVLEAMAVGKAVVSTTVGLEGIEGENGVHFVMADGPEAFASGVISLLSEAGFRDRLGANARSLMEQKYDWKAICKKMNQIYIDAQKGISN